MLQLLHDWTVPPLPVYGRIVLRYLTSLDQERDRLDNRECGSIPAVDLPPFWSHLGMMTSKAIAVFRNLSTLSGVSCTRQSPPVEKLGVRWACGTL
jgi:hypothetical protein